MINDDQDPLSFLLAEPAETLQEEDVHARQRRLMAGDIRDLQDAELLVEIRKHEFRQAKKIFDLSVRLGSKPASTTWLDHARSALAEARLIKTRFELQSGAPAPEAPAPETIASRFSPAQLAELETYRQQLLAWQARRMGSMK